MNKYKDFEDYFMEIENYATRAERFYEDLEFKYGDKFELQAYMVNWLKSAFDAARLEKEEQPKERMYSEEYDAYYNPITNEWIESKCDEPGCAFCSNRPERPL